MLIKPEVNNRLKMEKGKLRSGESTLLELQVS